jgi:hypothetical protein
MVWFIGIAREFWGLGQFVIYRVRYMVWYGLCQIQGKIYGMVWFMGIARDFWWLGQFVKYSALICETNILRRDRDKHRCKKGWNAGTMFPEII